MMTVRAEVLDQLAQRIARISLGRPLRVAIDGRTASGKTTLADEMAVAITRKGREVIRTSIDGFHRPRVERYARGRYSAEGYYYDARDLSAVRTMLLDPLGPNGNLLYRTASFDLDNDRPIEQAPQSAPADSILIVDGTFLQRPELREGWDITVFIATSQTVSEERGVCRDASRLGGREAALQLFTQRYRPAFDLYERLQMPSSTTRLSTVRAFTFESTEDWRHERQARTEPPRRDGRAGLHVFCFCGLEATLSARHLPGALLPSDNPS